LRGVDGSLSPGNWAARGVENKGEEMGHLSWRALTRPGLLAAVLATGTLAIPQAHAQFTYSDTSMSFEWGPKYTDPGSGSRFDKEQLFFTHADGYKYGENFFNVDVLFSNSKDPSGDTVVGTPVNSPNGSTEIFIVDRHELSGNAITGTEMFKFGGIVNDVRLEFGGNLGTQDTQFAESLKAFIIGPNIALNVPGGAGFWNLGFHMYKEWNSDGFGGGCGVTNGVLGCQSTGVNFDPTFQFETVWGVNFHVLGERIKFEGVISVILPKGINGGGVQTQTEMFSKYKLKYDIGNLILQKEHVVETSFGIQYWFDKFGNPDSGPNKLPGSQEFTPFVGVSVYF
jgi:hypothetical protein